MKECVEVQTLGYACPLMDLVRRFPDGAGR